MIWLYAQATVWRINCRRIRVEGTDQVGGDGTLDRGGSTRLRWAVESDYFEGRTARELLDWTIISVIERSQGRLQRSKGRMEMASTWKAVSRAGGRRGERESLVGICWV